MKLNLIIYFLLTSYDFAQCADIIVPGKNVERSKLTFRGKRKFSTDSSDSSKRTSQPYRHELLNRKSILPESEMDKILLQANFTIVPLEDYKCADVLVEEFKRDGRKDCLEFQRFGASIATMCNKNWCPDIVPNIVKNFAQFLVQNADCPGIFREIGRKVLVRQIIAAYDKSSADINLNGLYKGSDTLSVANAFLTLFREMQPGLFAPKIVNNLQKSNFADLHNINQLQMARRNISVMQPSNRAALHTLIHLFTIVVQKNIELTAIAIAVCVANSLLFDTPESNIKMGNSEVPSVRQKLSAALFAQFRPTETKRRPSNSNSDSTSNMSSTVPSHSVSLTLSDRQTLSIETARNNPLMRHKYAFIEFLIENFNHVFGSN